MSTFNEDNYLSIVFYLDGSNDNEDSSYEGYIENLDNEISSLDKEINKVTDANERFRMMREMDNVIKLKLIMQSIYDIDEEEYEE